MHYCDQLSCNFNDKQECIAGKAFHVGRLCVTFRGVASKDIMRVQPSNCHRNGTKWKSSRVKLIK